MLGLKLNHVSKRGHWSVFCVMRIRLLSICPLTHLPLDEMAAIVADDLFKCIFFNENDRIPIQMSLKFVPRSPIDNNPASVQAVAWRRTSEKPLPGPMLAQFPDAYMRHWWEISLKYIKPEITWPTRLKVAYGFFESIKCHCFMHAE